MTHESADEIPRSRRRIRFSRHTSVNYGHGICDEGVVCHGVRLHIWRHDLGMILQITLERVAFPASFCFDDQERNSSQEIFQSGTDSNSVSRDLLQSVVLDNFIDSVEESFLGHGAKHVLEFESKEVRVERRIVEAEVVV